MDWNVVLSAVLQRLLEYVLPLLAVAITGYLVALIKVKWAQVKSWNPVITDLLEEAVTLGVKAAEEAGAAGLAEDKRTYAFDTAEKWLAARGVTLDVDLIYAAIQAAVLDEFNKDKRRPAGFSGVTQ